MNRASFIRDRFAEFYEENASKIEAPSSISQREFGFFTFQENVVIRHKGFLTVEALRDFIRQIVPSHAYYSAAYYESPEKPMEEKGWLGADLYFDIDADHIPTECGKLHDTWSCKDCGFEGKGTVPDECPMCGSRRFSEQKWPCEVCLESAKYEAVKLLDFLIEDFGFSPGEIEVSFSGHRGYHVQVESEKISKLDSTARKEIVDYVTGVGLDPIYHGLESGTYRSAGAPGPNLDDTGWRGRIARGTHEFLLSATREDLEELQIKKEVIDDILSKKDEILKSWEKRGPWGLIKGRGKDLEETWRKIISRAVESQAARIDTVVTTDVHRLIRLPNTLHGKTGWLKVSFPAEEIEKFDPFSSAIAFKKGEATLYVERAPEFRIGEETFGPFEKKRVELPMAAAMFLLCKGVAEVVE
jgi:DNA primase small subunit